MINILTDCRSITLMLCLARCAQIYAELPIAAPLFNEATTEFATMKSTVSDPATGALTGYRWSRKAKPLTVPIAAGRPTS